MTASDKSQQHGKYNSYIYAQATGKNREVHYRKMMLLEQ